jgi:hypothetical protein
VNQPLFLQWLSHFLDLVIYFFRFHRALQWLIHFAAVVQFEKLIGQFLDLIVMSHWHVDVWIRIRDIFMVLRYYLCLCAESRLFISWCICDRCDMTGNDDNLDRSRRPGAEDRGWSTTGWILDAWTIERSGDTVCGMHRTYKDEEREFLDWPSKPRSKGFLIWASKLTAPVWWFESQNEAEFGLSVAP